MGGVVAWEIAQQLHADGQQVGLLALLETWPPTCAPRRPARVGPRGLAMLEFVVSRLRLYFETLWRLHGRQQLWYLHQRMAVVARRVAQHDLLGGNRPDSIYRS
jgi:thioesterase domain-containing protein